MYIDHGRDFKEYCIRLEKEILCYISRSMKGFRVCAAAIGSYETGIEIWDLDVLDAVEPAAVLGGPVGGSSAGVLKNEEDALSKKVRHSRGS